VGIKYIHAPFFTGKPGNHPGFNSGEIRTDQINIDIDIIR
jgi:hypothetical protein